MKSVLKADKFFIKGKTGIGVLLKEISDGSFTGEIHLGFNKDTLKVEQLKSGLGEISDEGGIVFIDGKTYNEVRVKVHESLNNLLTDYKESDLVLDRSI